MPFETRQFGNLTPISPIAVALESLQKIDRWTFNLWVTYSIAEGVGRTKGGTHIFGKWFGEVRVALDEMSSDQNLLKSN